MADAISLARTHGWGHIGLRGKPAALPLLNGHSIKLYSEFVLLSMYVNAALRLHQRRFLV